MRMISDFNVLDLCLKLCCVRFGMSSVLQITRRQRVMRLYRQALRSTLDWVWVRTEWFKEGRLLRQRFEQNKNLTDLNQIERVIAAGEAELAEKRHPDPYIHPYMYGGSKYARNAGVSKHVTYHMDFQREKPFWE